MGTSLADQLRKLALPQTSLLVQEKRRASLLFDPKEAANLDRETVFQLGLDGLEELKKLEPRFAHYQNTLFSALAKGLERSVQSSAANIKLDEDIRKFLFLLSPYFLMRCSHKALEWLIYRFHIHQFNVDDLLMLILPYHETRMFVRVLQLLDVKDPVNKWHWLRPLQKPGVPLSKLALLTHCASDASFLQFVCSMMMLAVKVHGTNANTLSTLYSFGCTTLVGALEHSKHVTEVQVTHILKLLLKGITFPVLDFCAASLVIAAQLVRKTHLSEAFLFAIIGKISKIPHTNLHTECVTLLVLLYQTQHEVLKSFPQKALKRIAKLPNFISALNHVMSSGGNIMPLLIPLLTDTLKGIQSQADYSTETLQFFAEGLLTGLTFDKKNAEIVIRTVIDAFDETIITSGCKNSPASVTKGNDEKSVGEWYASYLQSLDHQYSSTFDHIALQALKGAKTEKRTKALRNLLGFVPRVAHREGNTDVFEKLYHNDEGMRVEALKYFASNFKTLKEPEKQLLVDGLKDRLSDDSHKVIHAALNFPTSILASVVGADFLMERLISLAVKFWYLRVSSPKILERILLHLCSEWSLSVTQNQFSLLVTLLPYLLPPENSSVDFALLVMKSPFGRNNTFFTSLDEDFHGFKHIPEAVSVCSAVFKRLTNFQYLPDFNTVTETLAVIPQVKGEPVYRFLSGILLTTVISKSAAAQDIWEMLDTTLAAYVNNPKVVFVNGSPLLTGDLMPDCMAAASQKNLPLQALLYTLSKLLEIVSLNKDARSWWWDLSVANGSKDKAVNMLLIRLFGIIIKGCSHKKQNIKEAYISILKKFFQAYFPDLQDQLKFLSNVWVTHELVGVVDYELQLRSLLLGGALLRFSEIPIGWTLDLNNVFIVPSLLIAVTSPLIPIRVAALECLAVIGKSIASSLTKSSYVFLVEELLNREEELKLDAKHLSLALYVILSPDPDVQSLIVRSRRPHMSKILEALLRCAVDENTPVYVCSSLLEILSHVNSKNMLVKLVSLGERMLSWSSQNEKQLDEKRSAVLSNILSRLNKDTSKALEERECWDFFQQALHDYHTVVISENKVTCPAVLVLDQISEEVFASVTMRQQDLMALVVRVGTDTDSPEVVSAVGHMFKRIVLEAEVVVILLEKMKNENIGENTQSQKTTRKFSLVPPVDLLKSVTWREGVTLLELIQNKKKLHSVHLLLPVLSSILQRCLEFQDQASVEYIKQLLLSCTLHCCQKLMPDDSKEPFTLPCSLNVELVVQCVRGTQNPQTHHHALLVLSQMAKMIPERVLHNIMAIFTFMGSCILRQDDGYSFQVISKIVETVIPVIVKATEQGKPSQQLYDVAASVLRVFADALIDVPEHRRLPLFEKLLNTMGAFYYMWLLLCLVVEAQVRSGTKDQSKRMEFLLNISLKFTPDVSLQNCVNILEYMKSLPSDKDEQGKWLEDYVAKIDKLSKVSSVAGVNELFDVRRYSAKQLRHFKYMVITYLSSLLSSHVFISQVAELKDTHLEQMESIYRRFIENTLYYIQVTLHEADINKELSTAKYWKVMLHHGYDILDKVIALLPSRQFVVVVRGLLDSDIPAVRRKTLELFNTQLMQQDFSASCNHQDLLILMAPLMSIMESITNEEQATLEQQLNQQTALISIKLLARLIASENTSQFKEILDVLTEFIKKKTAKGNVLASLVLCVAELCSSLRAFAISSLPKVVPPLVKILSEERKNENMDMVLLCVISALHKIVESLPHFLSPYLEKILFEVCVTSAKFQEDSDNQKISPIIQKLKAIRQKLSGMIPPRVLVPSLTKCYSHLVAKCKFPAFKPLMGILADSFSTMSGQEFNHLQSDVTTFFLTTLQFRCDNTHSEISQDDILLAEGHIIQALVAFVLKLSESSFRPIFYKLFHWATSTDSLKDKTITFYRLSSSIAECLKGLFVLFAGHFVKNVADLLDQNNITKTDTLFFGSDSDAEAKSELLIEYILKTLHSVFLHDTQNFVNKERFEMLMQPLVDQLENTLGGETALQNRASGLLTPCIAQFAVAVADDSLWKQLNYQILLKTRHGSSQIRLISLETLCALVLKLGQDFLPFLPETVPFLAELLEDEEESVEKACQKAVQDLEEVLGEPLKKYF